MNMTQTTASGERFTMICEAGDAIVTRRQADSWLRLRQAAQRPQTQQQRLAS